MRKRIVMCSLLTAGLLMSQMTGCGAEEEKSASTETKETEESEKSQSEGIRVLNGKVEIDVALKQYAKEYEERTGVPVKIETVGGGADANQVLKSYMLSENMPDIYTFGGQGDYELWKEYMADLSNEKWVSDTEYCFIGESGEVVGFPYTVEGYGLSYNKDMLDKAGIDPAGLTTIDAYAEAFEKLDSMKEELGIDAVVSMGGSTSGQLGWVTGQHDFGVYLSTGLEHGDTSMLEKMLNGEVDEERLSQYADFVELLFKYSDPTVLASGTYDDQITLWESEKAVFIHQGSWLDATLVQHGTVDKFAMGMSPLAFSHEVTDGIQAGPPSYWAVYNESKHMDEAKAFLDALALEEEGQDFLVNQAKLVSPYKSCKQIPSTPLAKNLMEWIQKGTTYDQVCLMMPNAFGTDELAPIFELFGNGNLDKSQFIDYIKEAIAGLKE